MIYLREAINEDRDLLYEWVNDPETRRASFHSDIINYEEHCRWFEKILMDNGELQYILMDDNVPVGQIRLTLEGEDAMVSYSIAPDKRGQGYGKEIIRLIQEVARDDSDIHRLVAQVKTSNIASISCFEKCGFVEEYHQYTYETD